jgi:hypothetical protein
MMIIVCKNEGLYNFGNRYFWLMRSTIPLMEGGWGREGERERERERGRERGRGNDGKVMIFIFLTIITIAT